MCPVRVWNGLLNPVKSRLVFKLQDRSPNLTLALSFCLSDRRTKRMVCACVKHKKEQEQMIGLKNHVSEGHQGMGRRHMIGIRGARRPGLPLICLMLVGMMMPSALAFVIPSTPSLISSRRAISSEAAAPASGGWCSRMRRRSSVIVQVSERQIPQCK